MKDKRNDDLRELIQGFDLINFLENNNIIYSESGNEVSKNWIGIEVCPFCGKPNYHCAINKNYKSFSCWICGRRNIFEYISKQLKTNNSAVYKLLNKFQLPNTHAVSNKKYNFKQACSMPETDKKMKFRFREYLKHRGFPLKIIKKYTLKNTNSNGNFKHRLIFPFYVNNKLVTYIGRAIRIKDYKDCPIEESVMFPKGTLFNFDKVQSRQNILITEGVFDAMRIGDNCVSTSGTNYSDSQISLLLKKEPKKVYICYDNEFEAQEKAQSLAGKISLYVNQVEVITLPDRINDIGDLSTDEGRFLRQQLKLPGDQY